MISKTITLEEEHIRWVDDNCVNLSKYVRACIDKSKAGDPYEDDEAISAYEPHKGMFEGDVVVTSKGGRV